MGIKVKTYQCRTAVFYAIKILNILHINTWLDASITPWPRNEQKTSRFLSALMTQHAINSTAILKSKLLWVKLKLYLRLRNSSSLRQCTVCDMTVHVGVINGFIWLLCLEIKLNIIDEREGYWTKKYTDIYTVHYCNWSLAMMVKYEI